MQPLRIHIKMLGEFQVLVNDTVIGDSTRSNQIWNLLQYLVAFRHKVITQEELIDAMWEDGTGGYRGEEVVVVTEEGWIALTDYPYTPYGEGS